MVNHLVSLFRTYFINLLHNTAMIDALKQQIIDNQMVYLKMLESASDGIRMCKTREEYLGLADAIDEFVSDAAKYISDYERGI